MSKMDGNDRLEELLQNVIANSDQQRQLSRELGIAAPDSADQTSTSKETTDEQ